MFHYYNILIIHSPSNVIVFNHYLLLFFYLISNYDKFVFNCLRSHACSEEIKLYVFWYIFIFDITSFKPVFIIYENAFT